MTISLHPSEMYGHWNTEGENPKTCEFQHGRTMIYVQYDDECSMESRLAIAQASIDDAFDDIGGALAFASDVSAGLFPEFWKHAARIELRQSILSVFSVRYDIGTDFPSYDIWWNPRFRTEEGTAYSEDWVEEVVTVSVPDQRGNISIRRLGKDTFELQRHRVSE